MASGERVTLTFGSSGNLVSQIRNGAPFDLFLSADAVYPRQRDALGLVEPGTILPDAVGRLVLWARQDSRIDVAKGPEVLTDSSVKRIALANPDHAPYGRAAVATLRHLGPYDAAHAKLVVGENVAQAAQFVHSGNADAGFIALSLARTPMLQSVGTYFEVPASWHPPIVRTAVILAGARNKPMARRFLSFLQQPESVASLREAAFTVPDR
jgi:molybdate transport system substrate-binding protein